MQCLIKLVIGERPRDKDQFRYSSVSSRGRKTETLLYEAHLRILVYSTTVKQKVFTLNSYFLLSSSQ